MIPYYPSILQMKKGWFYSAVMDPKDADADSTDPDQTAPVCSDLSAPVLRIFMVILK